VPWIKIDFSSAFLCPHCGSWLKVPGQYSRRTSVVSLLATLIMAIGLGARGWILLLSVLVGFFPIAMVVGSIGKRLVPPPLILSAD
jgi:hypothetical protein